MKIRYIVGLLLVFLMIGCTTQPAAEPTAEEAIEEIVVEETEVEAEETEVEAEEPETPEDQPVQEEKVDLEDLTEVQMAHVESMISACKGGNLGLCTALETRYGLVVDREEASGIEDEDQSGIKDDSGVEGTQEDT